MNVQTQKYTFRDVAKVDPNWQDDFQDVDFMMSLANDFLDNHFVKSVKDSETSAKIKIVASAFAHENFTSAFALAESPIEKIFLSQVILSFFMTDPALLTVPPHPLGNFVDDMLWAKEKKTYIEGLASNGNRTYFEVAEQMLAPDDLKKLIYHGTNVSLGRLDSIYMCPQLNFKDVSGLGEKYRQLEGIRVDVFFTKLTNEKYKLVVECDGYEWHKDKESFIRDRKRDRALRAAGYDILRFSGSEIVRDPIACANELYSYIIENWEFDHFSSRFKSMRSSPG